MADFSHLTATEFLNSEKCAEFHKQFLENNKKKNNGSSTMAHGLVIVLGIFSAIPNPISIDSYNYNGQFFYGLTNGRDNPKEGASLAGNKNSPFINITPGDVKTDIERIEDRKKFTLKEIFKYVLESDSFNKGKNDLFYRAAREAFGVDMEYVSMMSFLEDGLNRGIKQFILHGAPGTGKTWAAEQFAKNNADNNRIRTVQFHPSYDYTDFIDGLRPIKLPNDNNPTFVRMDGVFKEFCREALKDKENKYFFLIDEINRADLSRVFGELMYCMNNPQRSDSEDKKRRIFGPYDNLTTYGKNCEPLTDDAFAEGFFIPENVIIIGTMNDIDKSVDSIDFALRRRFVWKKASAEGEANIALENYWKEKPERAKSCFERIKAVNAVIGGEPGKSLGLSEDYYIGHAYFMQGKAKKDEKEAFASDEEFFASVWHYSIKPVLESYCFGRDGEAFVGACKNKYFETGVSDAEVEQ